MIRDSYKNFFEKFTIDQDELIDYGVKEDTIYPNPEKIREKWDELKQNILIGGNPVSIRKYGRSGGSTLYIELYSILFPNCKIQLDPTNNAGPRKVLEASTFHSKYGKNKTIQNYQVAHVKGCTKNPLLFTAPWNIVWIPKIFDPFTGHESHGTLSEKYKTAFLKYWFTKYESLILEYNELILEHCSEKKLKSALTSVKMSSNFDEKLFKRFEKSVFEELSLITI